MVTGKRSGKLSAALKIRKHDLQIGILETLGGNDEGPSPHELIEAALAACTVLTIQMYANRKEWKLESTDVSVQIVSESKEGTRIKREVSFIGDLTQEQRQRLLEIANKCPIHNLLMGKVDIETSMIESQPA